MVFGSLSNKAFKTSEIYFPCFSLNVSILCSAMPHATCHMRVIFSRAHAGHLVVRLKMNIISMCAKDISIDFDLLFTLRHPAETPHSQFDP